MVNSNNKNKLPLVVHIIDRLPPDGAERLMVDILKNRTENFRFAVLSLVEGGALEEELSQISVPVTIFNKSSKFDFSVLFKLIFWFIKHKPSVVHTHLFTADTWGRLAASITRVPCIITTVHSTNTWKGTIHRFVDQVLSLITDRVVACSEEVANVLIASFKISRKRIEIISNGIDFNRFEAVKLTTIREIDSLASDITKMVVIGRLHPAKGHLDLIKAITHIKAGNTKFHVFLVGEGELKDQIITNCIESNINENVTLMGQRTDIPEILAKTDIFIMPSHWEGLPMALLEAMAMSMPVIATRVGGIPDVIENGVNGFLIDKSDDVELANKMVKLINDKELRSAFGNEAKKTVIENYSAKNASEKYELLYQTVLGQA
ncbi:MAG: glycosyltransferase [Thiohalomonadales bacterium]